MNTKDTAKDLKYISMAYIEGAEGEKIIKLM